MYVYQYTSFLSFVLKSQLMTTENLYMFSRVYILSDRIKGINIRSAMIRTIFLIFVYRGSDNSPLLTLFRVPWNTDSGRVVYDEDKEAWQYNGANSFGLELEI